MDLSSMNVWEAVSLCDSVSTISSSASSAEATAGNDVSSFMFDDFRDDSLAKSHCRHWLSVGNLSLSTTDTELKSLFYPYGADEAFTAWEGTTMTGFVGFDSPEMAELAAQKMHAFIPRRQTQALAVYPVSREEVITVRGRVPKSFLAVLYSECTVQGVSAFIRRSRSPVTIAGEVATEIMRASPAVLQRIVAALSDLSMDLRDIAVFNEELLKIMLRFLLELNDVNPAQAINCGAIVGHLFRLGMITGDPYYVALRLLEGRGVPRLSLFEGVCAIAHTCALLPSFHSSRASFWDRIAELATQEKDAELRHALLGHLRLYTKSSAQASAPALVPTPILPPSIPPPSTFSTMPRQPLVSMAPQLPPQRMSSQRARQEEMRRRTIYVSHLPGLLPQNMLLELLTAAGPVNKVRVCAGAGYCTLFAFVEMRTLEGAQRAMCMNGLHLMGFAVRVQTARNSVQDVVTEDAQIALDGTVIQPCRFGLTPAPLSQCLSPTLQCVGV